MAFWPRGFTSVSSAVTPGWQVITICPAPPAPPAEFAVEWPPPPPPPGADPGPGPAPAVSPWPPAPPPVTAVPAAALPTLPARPLFPAW